MDLQEYKATCKVDFEGTIEKKDSLVKIIQREDFSELPLEEQQRLVKREMLLTQYVISLKESIDGL